jgi:exocyst complex protein 7
LLVGDDGSYQNTLNYLSGGAQGQSDDSPSHLAAATMRIMSALQTNLDGKSKLCRDPALTWFFLMNDIHCMV